MRPVARRIDWTPQAGPVDWLHGPGATAAERRTVTAAWVLALVVLAVAAALGAGPVAAATGWAWWQLAVGAALVADLVGGAVANGLGSAKRLYHGPVPPPVTRLRRVLLDARGFAALHVHPLLVGVLFPGAAWWWGLLWYAWALLGVVAVHRAPVYLARPVALAVVAVGTVVSTLVTAPAGFAWLPAILLVKLVLAHAVVEEPYRPLRPTVPTDR